MAIALDATSSGRNSTGDFLDVAHTVGSGSNRVLFVLTSVQDGNHANYPIGVCTYGGVSLTKVRSDEATGNNRTEIWRLINPASGTANIRVQATNSIGEMAVIGISLTGVDQTTPVDAQNGTSGNSSTPSTSVTSVTDNAWFLTVCSAESTFSSNGTGQTTIATLTDQSFENARGTYEGPKTPAGAETQNFTLGAGQSWAISSVAVRPSSAAATTSTSTTSTSSSTSTSRTTSTSTTSTSSSTSTSRTTSTSTTSTSSSTSTSRTTSTSTTSTSSSTSTSTTSTSSSTSVTTSTSTTSTSSSTSTTQSLTTSTSTTSTSSSTSISTSTSLTTSTSTTTLGDCTEVLDQSQSSGSTNAGFGEFAGTRYRGQAFVPTYTKLEAISFQLASVGSQGMKVYIDTATGSIPNNAPGAELYSFTIPNANLSATFKKYVLPTPLSGLTPGNQYCFYLAPWNIAGNTYTDDYRDIVWINSNAYAPGNAIVNNAGTWSVSDAGNLDMKFETYGCLESGTTTSTSSSTSTSTTSTSSSTSTSTTSTSSSTSITTSTSTTISTSTTKSLTTSTSTTSTSTTQSLTTSTSTTSTSRTTSTSTTVSITTSTSSSTSTSTTITIPIYFEVEKQQQEALTRQERSSILE